MNRIVGGVGSNYLFEHMVIKIDVSIGIVIKLFMHFREKHNTNLSNKKDHLRRKS